MNVIIDNVQFTKFVLREKEMSEAEKEKFVIAVPKMTESEKAEMTFSIRARQLADMVKDLRGRLADPTLSKEEVKKIEDEWAMDKHKELVEKLEKEKIQDAQEHLKKHTSKK